MKTLLIIAAGIAVVLTTGLFAQSKIGGGPAPDLPKDRPRLSLTEAYTLATRKLGTETNIFHCVEASSRMSNSKVFRGWTFTFWSTNDEHFEVFVFYDGSVHPQRRTK